MITRNQIMDALMEVLEDNMPSIVEFTRRFKDLPSIATSAQMPYLMLTKPREQYPARAITQLPAKRTFRADITIALSAGTDQNGEPDRALCDILDQLDLALRPPVGSETLTLGGLVDHCYIEGDIICVPGDLDGIGMIQIPIVILVP